jgi:hypothetical protein
MNESKSLGGERPAITQVIEEVAFRLDLLALSAAVGAAREEATAAEWQNLSQLVARFQRPNGPVK